MPNAFAMRATAQPMRPRPMTPSTRPFRPRPSSSVGVQPFHRPVLIYESASATRLLTASRSAMAHSAVGSVTTPGVFVARMPRLVISSRSRLLKPTPQLATSLRRGAASRKPASISSPTIAMRTSAPRTARR